MTTLDESPLCSNLEPDKIHELEERGRVLEQPQGNPLFEKDEPGNDFYTILDGLVKVSVPDPLSERRKTLALLGPGDVLGEMAILTRKNRSGNATPARDTELFKIEKDDFMELFKKYPMLGLNLSRVLSRRLWDTDSEVQSTTFKTIPGRLASQLVRLAEDFGTSLEDGPLRLDIELTHEELADIVGTNRETITRHLNKFRDKEIISRDDNQIVIHDLGRLKGWM